MRGSREQDYLAKHRQIKNKLLEQVSIGEHVCVDVSELASELEMDIRTVKAHLRVMEVDAMGIFMDPSEKQFCTKEGIALLANVMKLTRADEEPKS